MNADVIALNRHSGRGCANCNRKQKCFGRLLESAAASQMLDWRVGSRTLQRGERICYSGDACSALFVLRAGHAKCLLSNRNGDEQITGFAKPGDLLGADGLAGGHYVAECIALDTVNVCQINLAQIYQAARRHGELANLLPALISEQLLRGERLLLSLSKLDAEQRMVTFLLDESQASQRNGCSPTRFTLAMSRSDIANHLNLAVETVSRLLTRLRQRGHLRLDRYQVEWLDLAALQRVGTRQDPARSDGDNLRSSVS